MLVSRQFHFGHSHCNVEARQEVLPDSSQSSYQTCCTSPSFRHHWMYNATAFNHAYADSGLFCVYSSAHPSQLRELCDVIVRELTAMAGVMDVVELEVGGIRRPGFVLAD